MSTVKMKNSDNDNVDATNVGMSGIDREARSAQYAIRFMKQVAPKRKCSARIEKTSSANTYVRESRQLATSAEKQQHNKEYGTEGTAPRALSDVAKAGISHRNTACRSMSDLGSRTIAIVPHTPIPVTPKL